MRIFEADALSKLRPLLLGHLPDEIEGGGLRRACVVIPLVPHGATYSLLFSQRSRSLNVHGGQISFPGGSAHEGETLEDAGLREMQEEVGVPAVSVELIGRMDDVVTRTGFIVAPFVGVLKEKPAYVLQSSEVDEVFEVPVNALLRPGVPEIRYLMYQGGKYPSYSYECDGVTVWGLTGRILKSFLDVVRLTL
ncbi:MAG TPA: CoA pyrophosphatase [Thermoanaerobaculia bacterium]|nr:CoA pyrophosphatase [Thermoanaerobaculia bacterium]